MKKMNFLPQLRPGPGDSTAMIAFSWRA